MSKQIYNFCAGPAMLPVEVMERAQREFCNFQGLGASVMELSHRGKPYMAVAEKAEADLRSLLAVPDNYKVLFMHGGGRGQFSAVPMNLLGGANKKADFLLTGVWSQSAVDEAKKYGDIQTFQGVAKNDSMFNTPPTYAWYLAGLVFEWLKEQGGLEAMEARNKEKADFLYDYLDQSSFYGNQVDVSCRSRMNIPFQLKNAELDKQFLAESEAAGLLALKGHRIVGGMRASIYNAMPLEGVKALVSFMDGFAKRHG